MKPGLSRALQVSEIVNTFSAAAIIWNALFGLASAASFDQSSGVAGWARHVGGGWAIAGASASFDVSWAHDDLSGFFMGVFKIFNVSDDTGVTAFADWIFWHEVGDGFIAHTFFHWFSATLTVVTAFVTLAIGWAENGENWLGKWARNWCWELKTEKFHNVWIANLWPFGNGVVRSAFKNSASINRVPNFSDVVVLAFVGTLFTVSGHATFTLNELWVGAISAKGIIEWMAKFWRALTFVLVATWINS